MGKVKLTLTVEEEVIERAKKLGLNLSQVAENAFIEMIKRIEGSDYPDNNDGSSVNASSQEGLKRARGYLYRSLCGS